MPSNSGKRSAREIWDVAKGALQVQVNKANYETWIKDTTGISCKGNQFIVGTPKLFAKEWLEKRLSSLVKKTLIGILGQDMEVLFQVCGSLDRGSNAQEMPRPVPSSSQPRLPLPPLNPRYTFESFVVGTSNRLAYSAAVSVAEEPGSNQNPLFIHSGCGLGKTHLAHAIGNEACENGLSVAYASAEQFTSEFVSSVRERNTDQFRGKFRSVDLFIIEDIQFLIGKPQTQMTLFRTFDELYNMNRQLVITANQPPGAMASLEKELGSRLECGLVAEIQPPDIETRLSILRTKAERQGVCLNQAVLELIAGRCQANVRGLEGCLNRLIAHARIIQKDLSFEVARDALEPLQEAPCTEVPSTDSFTPASILNAVAIHYNVPLESLQGRKRDSRLILARQIAIYLMREKTNYRLEDIGKLLGGRDHSTILRGYHRISKVTPLTPKIQRDIDLILRQLSA